MQKSLRSLVVAIVAVVGMAACSDDDGPTTAALTAEVRVVHASPDAPNVDVLVDDATALTAVPFQAASDYLEVEAGDRRVRVRAAGTTSTVIDANVDLAADASYTVLATGLLSDIQPLVATDDRAAPPAGQVKIRVIHAAPGAPNVDVYATTVGADLATSTPVLTNVPFRAISDYLTVPAGEYRLRVTPTGTTTVAIDATVNFAAGQVRTVVARDATGGGTPFGAIVLADLN